MGKDIEKMLNELLAKAVADGKVPPTVLASVAIGTAPKVDWSLFGGELAWLEKFITDKTGGDYADKDFARGMKLIAALKTTQPEKPEPKMPERKNDIQLD
jgi:hypothetical protein